MILFCLQGLQSRPLRRRDFVLPSRTSFRPLRRHDFVLPSRTSVETAIMLNGDVIRWNQRNRTTIVSVMLTGSISNKTRSNYSVINEIWVVYVHVYHGRLACTNEDWRYGQSLYQTQHNTAAIICVVLMSQDPVIPYTYSPCLCDQKRRVLFGIIDDCWRSSNWWMWSGRCS